MVEQKQIQKKIRFALSSQTSKKNLSFVILLMLMSLVRTRLYLAVIYLLIQGTQRQVAIQAFQSQWFPAGSMLKSQRELFSIHFMGQAADNRQANMLKTAIVKKLLHRLSLASV